MVKSYIYFGKTSHKRFSPVEHSFTYPLTFLGLNLREVAGKELPFQNERWSPLSLREKDYLPLPEYEGYDLEERFYRFLEREFRENGFSRTELSETLLVTMPKVFGYAFIPVTFYLSFGHNGELLVCIAEVNNTFDETHIYPYYVSASKRSNGESCFRFSKEFFVSPFFSVDGEYEVTVRKRDEDLFISVKLFREDSLVFVATLHGEGVAMDTISATSLFFSFLRNGWSTMPRILWQAVRLRFQRKLRFFSKPPSSHPSTVRKGPSTVAGWLRARAVQWL
jgi:DUF1365 family protein